LGASFKLLGGGRVCHRAVLLSPLLVLQGWGLYTAQHSAKEK